MGPSSHLVLRAFPYAWADDGVFGELRVQLSSLTLVNEVDICLARGSRQKHYSIKALNREGSYVQNEGSLQSLL